MRENYDEKDLEDALVSQITQFLLELGTGFSYVGRQIHLQVGEQDFYLDLLFYHIKLHCYVVAEYSLEEIAQPIGIAEYELEMVLKKEYQKNLPSIEELESEVAKMSDEN